MLVAIYATVVPLVSAIIVGLSFIALFFPKCFDSFVTRSGFAFGIGVALITFIELIFLYLGLQITIVNVGLALIFISIIFLLLAKKKIIPNQNKQTEPFNLFSKILFFLIIAQGIWVIIKALNFPFIVDDAIGMWSLKGKLIYYYNSSGSSLASIADEIKRTGHGDYPLLISLAVHYFNIFLSNWNDVYPKIIFPAFYFSLLVTFYHCLKQFTDKNYAVIFTFLLGGLAFLREQATWGTADLIFSFYYCTSVFLIFLWIQNHQNRYIYLSAVFCGFSIWTKMEGYPACVINLVVVVLFIAMHYKDSDREELKKLRRGAVGFIMIVLPFVFLVMHYQSLIGAQEEIINRQALTFKRLSDNLGKVPFILNKFQKQLFGAPNKWNILGYMLVLACLLRFRKIFRAPYLYMLLVISFNYFIYMLGFVLSNMDLDFFMGTAQNRMLLHFVPVMVFLLATLLYDKEIIG